MTMTETTTTAPAPVLDEETRRVLATAKGLVAKGWCQNVSYDGRGNHCIVGAVEYAGGRKLLGGALTAELALCRFTAPLWISDWNDMPGRTQAEVVALFDRALGA